jgi:hypothetical protein
VIEGALARALFAGVGLVSERHGLRLVVRPGHAGPLSGVIWRGRRLPWLQSPAVSRLARAYWARNPSLGYAKIHQQGPKCFDLLQAESRPNVAKFSHHDGAANLAKPNIPIALKLFKTCHFLYVESAPMREDRQQPQSLTTRRLRRAKRCERCGFVF